MDWARIKVPLAGRSEREGLRCARSVIALLASASLELLPDLMHVYHRGLLRTHHQRLSDHARAGFFRSPGRWTSPAAVRLPEDLDSMILKKIGRASCRERV